jgi:nicotinamidase/pyrazinamidase
LFETITLTDTGVKQVMWPAHCIQGFNESEFHSGLEIKPSDIIVSKGLLDRVDSYSGFGSPPEKKELEAILRKNQITNVFSCGSRIQVSQNSPTHGPFYSHSQTTWYVSQH